MSMKSQLRDGFMGSINGFPLRGARADSSFREQLNQVTTRLTQTLPHLSCDRSFTGGEFSTTADKLKVGEREQFETKLSVRVKVRSSHPVQGP